MQVSDTQGNGVANQKISLSVVPITYGKGVYYKNIVESPNHWDIILDTNLSPLVSPLICTIEDTNRNGVLDAGEDINGNGVLDPSNPASIGAHPTLTPTLTNTNSLVTNEFGFGYVSIVYPKSEALWSTVRITANTSVTGSESAATFDFFLLASQTDLESITTAPPGGISTSPYGLFECALVVN